MYSASCCYILALNAHCIFSILKYFKEVISRFISNDNSDATQNVYSPTFTHKDMCMVATSVLKV
jgi:hypothetical protein